MIKTIGSICSGIEAASVAWSAFDIKFEWFSEIAPFPSRVLHSKFPSIRNLGNMEHIPQLLLEHKIEAPDLLCGGTPCQAFSLAGVQNGLNDDRGNLTLRFVNIVEAGDEIRKQQGKPSSVVLWENVEGVLTDKTNAFGCFISALAGESATLVRTKWPNAGILYGPKRNLAWRVLDAKYFGLPQQRRRLYVLAGGKDFRPEQILFEPKSNSPADEYSRKKLEFEKDGHFFEIFRSYTDCLYAAYGTKWNGNAAATNGSLFIVQDHRIRRLSPLECERLMGFPDGYTALPNAKKTQRYQALGNSWAVPVIRWLGERLFVEPIRRFDLNVEKQYIDLDTSDLREPINVTEMPTLCKFGEMYDVVDTDPPEDIYISPVGCQGILRRKEEYRQKINPRLETVLKTIASSMPIDEIEKKSRVQKRGRHATLCRQLPETDPKARSGSGTPN